MSDSNESNTGNSVIDGDSGTGRHVRLRVDLVLEITDTGALTSAALDEIAGDSGLAAEEGDRAKDAVRADEAEALAYLVDPFDLVKTIPGVELVQASWNGAHLEYDPDDEEWDLYEADGPDEDSDG